ncbi:MAG: HAD hydrolase-like protein [Rhodospirillales bacterium]|nr:HAD hydrolase-like protein [Rhodospirillales bacterium]
MSIKLPKSLLPYKTWVFDCDGVILDSNRIKTNAFRTVVSDYGEKAAEQLVSYHVQHGGISRFEKMAYFFEEILRRKPEAGEVENVLDNFARASREGLMSCAESEGLRDLLGAIPEDVPRLVVSGSAQEELRDVFDKRGLSSHFSGIYGSPDNKITILNRERDKGVVGTPSLYIGDSKYDYVAATECGLDFVFIYQWSELREWESYFKDKKVPCFPTLRTFLELSQ